MVAQGQLKSPFVQSHHSIFIRALLLSIIMAFGSGGISVPAYADGDPWYEAVGQADKKIEAFERAVNSGDADAMRRAALDLQADPIAVKRFNTNSTDAYRTAHNNITDEIKNRTRQIMRERIAAQEGVSPDRVTTFEATNPPKPGDPVKVGQDWDITVRVDGRDVDFKDSKGVVHDAYYEAVHGTEPPSRQAATAFADRQALEVTSYQHPEAYGGAQSEGGKIISDPAGSPELRDPEGLGKTIEYKSNHARKIAEKLEAQGRHVEAQAWRMEQARQAAKQFDRQVAVRVAAMGGKVPEHLTEAMKVLRRLGDGEITPRQANELLAAMKPSTNMDAVIRKSAGLIESAQTLRPRGLGSQADVFVENAKNRLRAKGIDPDAIRPPSPDMDMTGPAARSWIGDVMKVLEVVGWAADFYDLSQAAHEYMSLYYKMTDPNLTDEEAERLFRKMEDAAWRFAQAGGMAALFEAYPPAAAVYGVYTITRLGLENTETGQRLDAAAFGFFDSHMQAAEQANCAFWDSLGYDTSCAQMEDQERDLLLAYLQALREGKIKLKKPFTAKDLGDMILAGVPVDDMIIRVDELERLTAANERYRALLAEVEALEARCQPLTEKQSSINVLDSEVVQLGSQLEGSINKFATELGAKVDDKTAACHSAPAMRDGVVAAADTAINQAGTAADAYSGAVQLLQECRSLDKMQRAGQLSSMGLGVAVGAARQALLAQEGYDKINILKEAAEAAAGKIAETGNQLNLFQIQSKTLRNKLDALKALESDFTALQQACVAAIPALQTKVGILQPMLPDQVATLIPRLQAIQALTTPPPRAADDGALRAKADRASQYYDTLSNIRTKALATLTQCRETDLPVAKLVAMNTAIRAIPDTQNWEQQIAQLGSACFQQLSAAEGEESGGDVGDEDDRGGYDMDEDEGNVDPERVAANGEPDPRDIDVGGDLIDDRTEQERGAGGQSIDPDYRRDPIAEAEREAEHAEHAADVARAGNPLGDRRDRGRGDIGDDFRDPPDIDRIPDRDRDDRGDRDDRDDRDDEGCCDDDRRGGGGDGRRGGRDGLPVPNPNLPTQPDLDEVAQEPPVLPEQPPAGEPEVEEKPPKPEPPEPEPKPDPKPGPKPEEKPEPPPPTKPEPEEDPRCRQIVNRLVALGNDYMALVNKYTAAVQADDKKAAQRYACQVVAMADQFFAGYDDLKAARCPIQGDVKRFESEMRRSRNQLRRSHAKNCGGAAEEGPVTQFAGRWGRQGCDSFGDGAYKWLVDLSQSGDQVRGSIKFHLCPGGGRATYSVSGTATSAESVQLGGTLSDSRGPLSNTARSHLDFTVTKGAPPSPNLAR